MSKKSLANRVRYKLFKKAIKNVIKRYIIDKHLILKSAKNHVHKLMIDEPDCRRTDGTFFIMFLNTNQGMAVD